MALLERTSPSIRSTSRGQAGQARTSGPAGVAPAYVGPASLPVTAVLRRPRARRNVPRWTPLTWLALLADHRRHARSSVRPAAPGPGARTGRSAVPSDGVPVTPPPATLPATGAADAGSLGRVTRPAVVAHRGNSSVAPQNTLAAIEAACRAGADAVEIDLQRTADGAAVVMHDNTVDETTDGTGKVADLRLEQVRGLDAGAWFGSSYAGQQVPLFAEVLELLRRYPDTRLLLELKNVWGPEAVREVTSAIDDAGIAGRVVVQSFWPDTVAAARDTAPHLPRGLLLAFEPPDVLDVCAALDVIACNPSADMVRRDPGIVARLHAAGLRVMVWTENDLAGWSALCAVDDGVGVDAIITDRPDRLLGWLSR